MINHADKPNTNDIETDQREIKREYVLMVEGPSDMNFFQGLLKRSDDIDLDRSKMQIITANGKNFFPNKIDWLKRPDRKKKITRIGFVRDADENPAQSAFQSICHFLKENSFPVPQRLSDITQGDLRCGIFIMPDNESRGMLESLCLESIQSLPIAPSIDRYLDAVKENSAEMYDKLNLPKSKVLTYLAGRYPDSGNVGLGAQQGHFNFRHECFNPVKNFLNRLYT